MASYGRFNDTTAAGITIFLLAKDPAEGRGLGRHAGRAGGGAEGRKPDQGSISLRTANGEEGHTLLVVPRRESALHR